ncbi:MAG: element excision factor XisH family protein, partial [Nostoc sp.]
MRATLRERFSTRGFANANSPQIRTKVLTTNFELFTPLYLYFDKPARDIYHDAVKNALVKEVWIITDD